MANLRLERINVTYTMQRSGKPLMAVADVSFVVEDGEFVAIVGPSGCGKTTILSSIAGLVRPAGGRIILDGAEIVAPGRERALVFQTPSLLPWRTAIGNVAYGLELHGRRRRDAERLAQAYIDLVGLARFEHSYPHELSGGMQQRVNLARALAVQPRLLLFDEPLSALDAQTREHMQDELQRIWLLNPTTTVYVTHQISEAVFLADRIVVLTASPGHVKEIVAVNIPRPRHLWMQRTDTFRQLENRIWQSLEAPAGFGDAVGKSSLN